MRLLQDQLDEGNEEPVFELLDLEFRRERERIELHPYNVARRGARVPRAVYAAELRAWRSIFEALEAEIEAREDPIAGEIWDPQLTRAAHIRNDLSRLDLHTHYIILKAQIVSERWAKEIKRATSGALIGTLYMLERSVPGGAAPHRAMARTLQLAGSDRLAFRPRDPFGEPSLELASRLDLARGHDALDHALTGCQGAASRTLELLDALSRELYDAGP